MDDLEHRVAKALYPCMVEGSDYDEVSVNEAFGRPRYQHLREKALAVAKVTIAAVREWDKEHGYDNSLITRAATGGDHDPI